MILPDSFLVLDFMASEVAAILRDLVVHPDRMARNLEAGGGLVFSQLITLYLTPVVYTYMAGVSERRTWRKSGTERSAAPVATVR